MAPACCWSRSMSSVRMQAACSLNRPRSLRALRKRSSKPMMLLNPGPVNVSDRVRQALLKPDLCHREPEFTALLHGIQDKLLRAFVPGGESDYAAVLITGSGTAAVESALMSSIPHGRRILILNNGIYGERLSNMVGLHRLGVS